MFVIHLPSQHTHTHTFKGGKQGDPNALLTDSIEFLHFKTKTQKQHQNKNSVKSIHKTPTFVLSAKGGRGIDKPQL